MHCCFHGGIPVVSAYARAAATVKIAAASSGVAPQNPGSKGRLLTQQLSVVSMGPHTLASEQLSEPASNSTAYARQCLFRSTRVRSMTEVQRYVAAMESMRAAWPGVNSKMHASSE